MSRLVDCEVFKVVAVMNEGYFSIMPLPEDFRRKYVIGKTTYPPTLFPNAKLFVYKNYDRAFYFCNSEQNINNAVGILRCQATGVEKAIHRYSGALNLILLGNYWKEVAFVKRNYLIENSLPAGTGAYWCSSVTPIELVYFLGKRGLG